MLYLGLALYAFGKSTVLSEKAINSSHRSKLEVKALSSLNYNLISEISERLNECCLSLEGPHGTL